MSQVNPYGTTRQTGVQKRTFESTLVHLLETEYGLIGGLDSRDERNTLFDTTGDAGNGRFSPIRKPVCCDCIGR